MAFAPSSSSLVLKTQSAASAMWDALQGQFSRADFSPEEALIKSPHIDPRFIAKAPMSNANLDVHTLNQLGAMGLKRGKEVTAQTHPELYRAWEKLSARAGLKQTPQLILVESNTINAFTISPQEMVVTTGILKILTLRELDAVLGHELGHGISDHTTPRILASGGFIGAGALIGERLSHMPLPEGLANSAVKEKGFWSGLKQVLHGRNTMPGFLSGTVASMALGGWLGSIVANQVSVRPTELDADRKGAIISNDPEALISALTKLENSRKGSLLNQAWRLLCSGYPSTETRIEHLHEIARHLPRHAPEVPPAGTMPLPATTEVDAPLTPGVTISQVMQAERVGAPLGQALANG
jgi:Zn-dependent protease with chaperone function